MVSICNVLSAHDDCMHEYAAKSARSVRSEQCGESGLIELALGESSAARWGGLETGLHVCLF